MIPAKTLLAKKLTYDNIFTAIQLEPIYIFCLFPCKADRICVDPDPYVRDILACVERSTFIVKFLHCW